MLHRQAQERIKWKGDEQKGMVRFICLVKRRGMYSENHETPFSCELNGVCVVAKSFAVNLRRQSLSGQALNLAVFTLLQQRRLDDLSQLNQFFTNVVVECQQHPHHINLRKL